MQTTRKMDHKVLPPGARERLIDAAVSIFASKGYAAASVKEIVEKVGVTKPVLYYYFKNKEGLFTEIMESAKCKFLAVLQSAQEGEPLQAVTTLCDRILDLLKENADYHRLIHMVYFGPPQGAPPVDFELFHFALHDALYCLVQKGMRQGSLLEEDPENVVRVLLSIVSFCLDVQMYHPDLAPGKEGQRRMLDLVFRGMAAPAYRKSMHRPKNKVAGRHGSLLKDSRKFA